MSLQLKEELLDMIDRYRAYGWSKGAICRKWDISPRSLSPRSGCSSRGDVPKRFHVNAITEAEMQTVKDYALTHTHLNHREMTYRMIDEDEAYMSVSSVYRILRENNLLARRNKRPKPIVWDPHKRADAPDLLWQTDLMIIRYNNRDYYLLSYMDTYSRFIVYHQLCLSMTGDTIKQATVQALAQTRRNPKYIQSDNGSCYISQEYRSYLSRSGIDHKFIHPHCPNENAEIERYHRTLRELIDPEDAENFQHLNELVKEQIDYYNYQRYHSAIGFITTHDMDRGRAGRILEKRKRKLQRAKEKRIKHNLQMKNNQKKLLVTEEVLNYNFLNSEHFL